MRFIFVWIDIISPSIVTVKSYYSLGLSIGNDSYTEDDVLGYAEDYYGANDKGNDPEGQKVEDYSKIIEELQSHRKEIEKLQLDMGGTSTVRNISSGLSISNQEYITQNEFFPFCPLEELQHQLDDIIDKDVSGKEDYFTADDFIHADQGFMLKEYFCIFTFRLSSASSTFQTFCDSKLGHSFPLLSLDSLFQSAFSAPFFQI